MGREKKKNKKKNEAIELLAGGGNLHRRHHTEGTIGTKDIPKQRTRTAGVPFGCEPEKPAT